MTIDIRMPEISPDITEADVVAWLVEPGESVQEGDILLEIETEKSTVEIESPATGVLTEVLVPGGTAAVAVGTVLARLEPAATAGDSAASISTPAAASSPAPDPEPHPIDADHGAEAQAGPHREPAPTALARRLADQAGVALDELKGTGAHGRITRADVEDRVGGASAPIAAARGSAEASATTAAPQPRSSAIGPAATGAATSAASPARPGREPTRVPLSRMRRTIAARLSESKRTIPHFYLAVECEIDALLEARRQLNETEGARYKISVNDFVVRAAALALREVPAANVTFDEDALVHHTAADVAVAVATEGGLITPIVRDADLKGLGEISAEVRELATRARDGKLSPRDYQGGSFSISNLGMYGIDSVYPIVNPPHSGILGVGQGRAAAVVRDGAVVPATVMTCTLAADHRAVDGAIGAQWLAAFKRLIESPLEMSL